MATSSQDVTFSANTELFISFQYNGWCKCLSHKFTSIVNARAPLATAENYIDHMIKMRILIESSSGIELIYVGSTEVFQIIELEKDFRSVQ